jgi:nitrite reductase/ring-hydroxylating ferredoxin subunit
MEVAMSRADRRLSRYIRALIADRRPPRSPADDDARAMQVAARLRAAHPGGADPAPAFVDHLARQLRDAGEHDSGWVDNGIQRRRFLAGGIAAVAASVAVGVGAERIREVLSEPQTGTGPIVPYLSAWVAVATLDDVAPGKIKQFSEGGIQGVLFTLHGEVRGLSAVCTHQGCTLVPEPAENKLVCPCHPMSFALTGEANPGDYRLNPLPTVQTRVTGNNVEVLVPNWT